jgi:hypothetical protein
MSACDAAALVALVIFGVGFGAGVLCTRIHLWARERDRRIW